MAPLALGGSVPNLQPSSGSDSGDAIIRSAPLTLPHPSNKDGGTLGGCSFLILPQFPPPSTLPPSPGMTYSNLSFPKRGEETPCESRKVEGEESKNGHPAADKIAENVPSYQAQAAGPSYACVVKKKMKKKRMKKTDGKQTWVEMEEPQEMPLPAKMWPPPPTKAIEEMYSVVCKEKKKKKGERSERPGKERDPQAEVKSGHPQGITVNQESNGIASFQSSVLSTATEPYYESVPCESWPEVASQPMAEPAYEPVDTYWNKGKKKPKKAKKNTVTENFYESIDHVTFQGQGRGRTSHLES
ncbi:uncharacterized protein LOC120300647 isoform X2 [Crotalus tigris]|nr:uncharacterized protein LOC120300647 isoform X2 [Crotalus tigris]